MTDSTQAAPGATEAPPVEVPTPALIEQLKQLNERARMHANRLWQLPFAFLGLVALVISKVEFVRAELAVISAVIAVVGVCVLFAMLGAYEGVSRAGGAIADIEARLGLRRTASLGPDWLARLAQHRIDRLTSHFLPYFVIVAGIVIAACVLLAVAATSGGSAKQRPASAPARIAVDGETSV